MVTVRQLIESLHEMDQDAEVRFAHQPSWPLQNNIRREVAFRTEGKGGQKVVYLLDDGQNYHFPYAPSDILNGELEDAQWTSELYCPECERTDIEILSVDEDVAMVRCNRCKGTFEMHQSDVDR